MEYKRVYLKGTKRRIEVNTINLNVSLLLNIFLFLLSLSLSVLCPHMSLVILLKLMDIYKEVYLQVKPIDFVGFRSTH